MDQNSQANINILVTVVEDIKLTEVNSWADASRQKEQLEADGEGQSGPGASGLSKVDVDSREDGL